MAITDAMAGVSEQDRRAERESLTGVSLAVTTPTSSRRELARRSRKGASWCVRTRIGPDLSLPPRAASSSREDRRRQHATFSEEHVEHTQRG